MHELQSLFHEQLEEVGASKGKVLVLTGAGVSKASGMPTYRGEGGMWIKGSRFYRNPSRATKKYFMQNPEEAWQYSLHRLFLYQFLEPNPAHLAIKDFLHRPTHHAHLITQNVDRLHWKSGVSLDQTFEIHGNLSEIRCSVNCTDEVYPLPRDILRERDPEEPLSASEWTRLRCPRCGAITRPHVLWFDESYNELHFRYESALQLAEEASLLVILGTTIATNLPKQIVKKARKKEIPIWIVNFDETSFTREAEKWPNSQVLYGKAEELLPDLL